MTTDTVHALRPVELEYVQGRLAAARQALGEARTMFAVRPALTAPADHVDRAVTAAHNAAEHLYDIGQVDDPTEAVREALAAAEVIMDAVAGVAAGAPGAADVRTIIATQMLDVDMTLAGLERQLQIPVEQRHAATR